MAATRPSAMLASLIHRPVGLGRIAPTAYQSLRSRPNSTQGYGDGQGDPKAETPQQQGSNPSADLEHPGPPPVKEGQGSGSGPTKGSSEGHNSSPSSSSSSSSGGSATRSSGAQPKIHDERDGPASNGSKQAEVDQHNRDFENRHGRAQSETGSGDEKVDKSFWSGMCSSSCMIDTKDRRLTATGHGGRDSQP